MGSTMNAELQRVFLLSGLSGLGIKKTNSKLFYIIKNLVFVRKFTKEKRFTVQKVH